jgi:acyl carrier protein
MAAAAQADVVEVIREFLVRVLKPTDLTPDTQLYAEEGIGLDSLETAELSALLEDEFGADPFSTEEMPQTVGDILAFYDSALAADA